MEIRVNGITWTVEAENAEDARMLTYSILERLLGEGLITDCAVPDLEIEGAFE